jgi:hypothetical protein
MGFNRRKMEDQRRDAAEKEAAKQSRATDGQVLEDAERLITAWKERQAKRMPMIFSPQSAPQLPHAIGFCGCAVPRAGPSTQSTYARSTATTTRPCRASFRRCPVVRAGRTHRSRSSCAYRGRASLTKCARSIGGECLANSGPARAWPRATLFPQELWQLGDVRRDPSRLGAREAA